MDGVLEMEVGGRFSSGADAHAAVISRSASIDVTSAAHSSATGRLSASALDYASALQLDDADRLSAKLYFYNRKPLTPAWRERLPEFASVERFLRLGPGSRTRAVLDRSWRRQDLPAEIDGWIAWRPRSAGALRAATRGTFKVYVSPQTEQCGDAIEVVLEAMAATGPAPFKIGGGVYSLLRPDKVVVYFAERRGMEAFLDALRPKVAGLQPHGVPFSADVTGDGLLSWGLDPPEARLPWSTVKTQSWRVAVASRLARSLILARHARTGTVTRTQFALDRLALDGIDVSTWAPRAR